MTYEFFEKRGKKVTRRWAGLKGEMEALRREHMKAKRNPARRGQLLFRTRAAAVKYAKSHGAKRYSVRKLRRA